MGFALAVMELYLCRRVAKLVSDGGTILDYSHQIKWWNGSKFDQYNVNGMDMTFTNLTNIFQAGCKWYNAL